MPPNITNPAIQDPEMKRMRNLPQRKCRYPDYMPVYFIWMRKSGPGLHEQSVA